VPPAAPADSAGAGGHAVKQGQLADGAQAQPLEDSAVASRGAIDAVDTAAHGEVADVLQYRIGVERRRQRG